MNEWCLCYCLAELLFTSAITALTWRGWQLKSIRFTDVMSTVNESRVSSTEYRLDNSCILENSSECDATWIIEQCSNNRYIKPQFDRLQGCNDATTHLRLKTQILNIENQMADHKKTVMAKMFKFLGKIRLKNIRPHQRRNITRIFNVTSHQSIIIVKVCFKVSTMACIFD